MTGVQTCALPISMPDSSETISYDTDDVWYQWTVWDNMTKNLRNLNHKPTDPLLNTEYIYSTTSSQKEYEVLALYEWSEVWSNMLISQTYAADNMYPKVDGSYNWVYVKTSNYIIPTPSLITSETLPYLLTWSTIESQVVTWWSNIPAVWWYESQTGWLVINLSATWTLDGNSTDAEKISVIETIQNAYRGTSISSNTQIAYILNQTTSDEMITLADITVLNWVTTSTNIVIDETPVDPYLSCTTQWEILDSPTTYWSCDTPDIVICNWTWTWYVVSACNVWATKASEYDLCTSLATCTTERVWDHIQFWKSDNSWTIWNAWWSNDWKASGWTDWWSANDWWVMNADRNTATYNNSTSENQAKMQWPCDAWYHVPRNINRRSYKNSYRTR